MATVSVWRRPDPEMAPQPSANGGPIPLLLTVADVAKLLNLSKTSVWGLIRDGRLPSILLSTKVRRVAHSDLVEYVERLPREGDYWPK